MTRAARWIVLAALAASAAVSAAPEHRPAIGRHAGQLCVTTASAEPGCGPAQLDLRPRGRLSVRVDDLVYRLQLHSSQVEVVLMHGFVEVDEFTVPYEWSGNLLTFTDDERKVRYEVRFTKRGAK
jgi:hypothetical protein